MKKTLLFLAFLAALLPARAQLSGNGYYRGKNYDTERYIYVTDDKGSVSVGSTNADVLALQLWKDFLKASSDPATILSIDKNGSKYNIGAQGTSVQQMVNMLISIMQSGTASNGEPLYMVYGTKSGAVKYLGDAASPWADRGEMSTNAQGDNRKWYIIPVKADSQDGYFGVKPTVNAGGKYWYPMFAGFPYSAYSKGVKFYTITKVDQDLAVMEEVSGTVPASTGVIIECANPLATDNRLNVGGTASALSGNQLGGVYFHNEMPLHLNLTPYNKDTMRLLSSDASGNLVFVTGTIEYLPANESYLKVPKGTPATLKVVTPEQYQAEQAKRPTSVSVSPASLTIKPGEKSTLYATVLPETAETSLSWTSSDTSVATVDSRGIVTGVKEGKATITVTTGNGLKASASVKVELVATGVTLAPATLNMVPGETSSLTATVTPAGVQTTLTWTSSDPTVATVDSKGGVKALKNGSTTITVTTGNGLKATASVKVEAVATGLTVAPATLTLIPGEVSELTATITPEDAVNKTVRWGTSNHLVATVSETGAVTAVSPGSAIITGTTANGISATCAVTVNAVATGVKLSSHTLTLTEGDSSKLTATVTPSNAIDKSVSWTSSDPSVASVDSNGNISAVSRGTAVITVTTANGLTDQCTVTVNAPLPSRVSISPSGVEITEGETATFTVTISPANAGGYTLSWISSQPDIAEVDENGNVTAISEGTAIITVLTSNNLSASATVRVAKAVRPVTGVTLNATTLSLTEGDEATLIATVLPADATDPTVVWTTSDASVVTVDRGLISALAAGNAIVTATAGNFSAECEVTVIAKEIPVVYPQSITLSETAMTVDYGETIALTATVEPDDATDKSVSWSVSDTAVLEATEIPGEYKAVGGGVAKVTATTVNGLTAVCEVTVYRKVEEILLMPDAIDVVEGSSVTVTAEILPVDATDKVLTWTVEDSDVATIEASSEAGCVIHIAGEGSTVLTVTCSDGVSATCLINGRSGIEAIMDESGTADVYTATGLLLRRAADADYIRTLAPGLYIIAGRKVLL